MQQRLQKITLDLDPGLQQAPDQPGRTRWYLETQWNLEVHAPGVAAAAAAVADLARHDQAFQDQLHEKQVRKRSIVP